MHAKVISIRSGLKAIDPIEEFAKDFHDIRPEPSAYEKGVWTVMKPLMEERMKMTGQNGLADYDAGFTDFIHTQG